MRGFRVRPIRLPSRDAWLPVPRAGKFGLVGQELGSLPEEIFDASCLFFRLT